MEAIAAELDLLRLRKADRLRITMPPRHGKTETCTIRLVVRWLLDNPEATILVTGYNQKFANRLSKKIRELAKRMGIRLKKGSNAMDEWETEHGGTVVARGVGSVPTGIGFDLIVIDDPVRDHKKVESELQREDINEWYRVDIYQRLQPGGVIVLVMTQWHEFDLATEAIRSEPEAWRQLVLRSMAEDDDDPLGRKKGEALWKEQFPTERLVAIRQVMSAENGPRMFDALFQCRPYAKEGNQLKRADFQIIEAHQVPAGLRKYRVYDCALSEKQEADESSGTLGGMDEKGNLYILDQESVKLDVADTYNWMIELMKKDGPGVAIGIERPLAGTVYMQFLNKDARAANRRVVRVEVRGRSKLIRFAPWAIKARNRQLFLVRGEWNEGLIKQALAFTGKSGNKDDRVDSISVLTEAIALGAGDRDVADDPPKEGSYEYWQQIKKARRNGNG